MEVTGPNTYLCRAVLSQRQLEQHEGSKSHSRQLGKKFILKTLTIAKSTNTLYRPIAKHECQGHLLGCDHRRNNNNIQFKNTQVEYTTVFNENINFLQII